jgi:hypothetical protein
VMPWKESDRTEQLVRLASFNEAMHAHGKQPYPLDGQLLHGNNRPSEHSDFWHGVPVKYNSLTTTSATPTTPFWPHIGVPLMTSWLIPTNVPIS